MTTDPLRKCFIIILKEFISFIGCLYHLSVHLYSFCFYIQYHGGLREINSMAIYIFCFILCSILLRDEETLDSFIHVRTYDAKKVPIWTCPPLPPPQVHYYSYAPVNDWYRFKILLSVVQNNFRDLLGIPEGPVDLLFFSSFIYILITLCHCL